MIEGNPCAALERENSGGSHRKTKKAKKGIKTFTPPPQDPNEGKKEFVKFETYKDEVSEWRWRLIATNGRVVGDSGEGYKNKKDCLREINKIRATFGANTLEVEE